MFDKYKIKNIDDSTLNNLFYIAVKGKKELCKYLENVWKTIKKHGITLKNNMFAVSSQFGRSTCQILGLVEYTPLSFSMPHDGAERICSAGL